MARLDRLYAVAEQLRAAAPRLVTVAELAARHEVSERTVQRDLQTLLAAGVPLTWVEGRGGGWTMETSASLPPLNLSPEEAAALLLAARSAPGTTPMRGAISSALAKLAAVVRPDTAQAVASWDRRVVVGRTATGAAGVLGPVESSVEHRRPLRITYRSRSGTTTGREVEPIGMMASAGQWYLIAHCRLRDAPRAFRLDRIDRAETLPGHVPERDLVATLRAEGVVLERPDPPPGTPRVGPDGR